MSIFEALADPLPDRFFQSRLGFEHFNTFRKQILNASGRGGGTQFHPELQTAYVKSLPGHPEILRPHAAVRKCPFGAMIIDIIAFDFRLGKNQHQVMLSRLTTLFRLKTQWKLVHDKV